MKYVVKIHTGHLRVREAPSLAAPVVHQLVRGEVVEVTSGPADGGWCELATGGWVDSEFLEPFKGLVAPRIRRPPNTGLPPFQRLWDNYPSEHDALAVKKAIGGKVNAPWITNTCTIRLSRAFNYAGQPIPAHFPGLHTVAGADGKAYAFRVSEMSKYLASRYGHATYIATGAEGRTRLAGHRGVIMFDVRGWNDATGHFDIWNGSTARYSAYFEKAARVLLWSCM